MSINSVNKKEILNNGIKYFATLFNIDLQDKYTLLDLQEELENIKDIVAFRNFVKNKISYEKYRYLSPYQKFVTIIRVFKKENSLKLDEYTQTKVNNFAYKLYAITTSIFEEVNFLIQMGNDLRSQKITKFISFNYFHNAKDENEFYKQQEVLKRIGSREILLNLCKNNKPTLEKLIYENVTKLALLNKYPQLKNNSKESLKTQDGLETIKKLQERNIQS